MTKALEYKNIVISDLNEVVSGESGQHNLLFLLHFSEYAVI